MDANRSSGVRHRKIETKVTRDDDNEDTTNKKTREPDSDSDCNIRPLHDTYWLTRIVLLRYVGFIYSFGVALHQNKALIGSDGLLPADKYLDDVKQRTGGINLNTYTYVPSLVWLFDYNDGRIDTVMDYIAYAGLLLSAFVMLRGAANWFIMLGLWMLYHSVVNIGQRWYGFGWESQLLESGFLAVFLCPVWNLSTIPKDTPTSQIVIWAYRWLIFRIMLGAGLIKIRGDKCWRDLTCMNYHYETQPVPNPMSYYMHQSPEIWHKFETLSNHFVELIAPFLLLLNRPLRHVGGIIQILFQVVLIISGNLSFLNWLTILPPLACFDDATFAWMFSSKQGSVKWTVYQIKNERRSTHKVGTYIRKCFNISFGVLIAYLSIPVVQNLLSSRQAMNTSFDPLRLVNTYGAFGSITKKRTEVIFQGTYSDYPDDPDARWEEYEFKCKPGNTTRRPCIISPYHYRLDWLMWFAAFQNYQHNPWLVHLGVKLLANDEDAVSLIEYNPFHGKKPPKYVRAEHYRYQYTKIGSRDSKRGAWWKRTRMGNYLPPISIDSIQGFLKHFGYKTPRLPP